MHFISLSRYHILQKKATQEYLSSIILRSRHILPSNQGKEEPNMNCHANKCIECTVKSCAYHCDTENYCSLDRILVGTHENNPTVDQCTDCMSFRKK